jgi:hypothetical protein
MRKWFMQHWRGIAIVVVILLCILVALDFYVTWTIRRYYYPDKVN